MKEHVSNFIYLWLGLVIFLYVAGVGIFLIGQGKGIFVKVQNVAVEEAYMYKRNDLEELEYHTMAQEMPVAVVKSLFLESGEFIAEVHDHSDEDTAYTTLTADEMYIVPSTGYKRMDETVRADGSLKYTGYTKDGIAKNASDDMLYNMSLDLINQLNSSTKVKVGICPNLSEEKMAMVKASGKTTAMNKSLYDMHIHDVRCVAPKDHIGTCKSNEINKKPSSQGGANSNDW